MSSLSGEPTRSSGRPGSARTTRSQRAYDDLLRRAWPLFREAARTGTTMSYSELAGRIGPPAHQRGIHRTLLTPVSERCRRAGLPDLAALIVRKDSGVPGGGWFAPYEGHDGDPLTRWAEALAACYHYAWPARPDPRLLAVPEDDPEDDRPRG